MLAAGRVNETPRPRVPRPCIFVVTMLLYATGWTGPEDAPSELVNVYDLVASGGPSLIRSLTDGPKGDLGWPVDVAVDSKGNIYVADESGAKVLVFGPSGNGNIKPLHLLGNPSGGYFGELSGIAIDNSDRLLVLYADKTLKSSLAIYPFGAKNNDPASSISNDIEGKNLQLALDDLDQVYIVERKEDLGPDEPPNLVNSVRRFKGLGGTILSPSFVHPGGMAATAANVYVANGPNVLVFEASSFGSGTQSTPIRTISGPKTGIAYAVDVAIDDSGLLYVANNPTAEKNAGGILVFANDADGNTKPIRTISGLNPTALVVGLSPPPTPPDGPSTPGWKNNIYEAVAQILFGVVQDGGGAERVGPYIIPVHPSGPPDPVLNILLGLASYRIASAMHGPEGAALQKAAMKVVAQVAASHLESLNLNERE